MAIAITLEHKRTLCVSLLYLPAVITLNKLIRFNGGKQVYTPIFKKNKTDYVICLKVFGVSARTCAVIWDTPIEYVLARYFIDNLNKHDLPEENILDVIYEFLEELDKLNYIDLKNTKPQIIKTKPPHKFLLW